MSKKILITGGNSAIAMKLAKLLHGHQLFLGDYGDIPHLETTHLKLIPLGQENQEITAHQLLTACLDFQIDILLPLRIFEIEAVAKSEVLFREFGISLMLPPKNKIEDFLPTKKTTHISLKCDELALSSNQISIIPVENGAFFTDEENVSLVTI